MIEYHLADISKSKIGKSIQIHPFFLVHLFYSIQYLSHKKIDKYLFSLRAVLGRESKLVEKNVQIDFLY